MDSLFDSVFSHVDAFVYRCRNDTDYTMEAMEGRVKALTGYDRDDIVGNARVSYVGLTLSDDQERVFAEVDAAIAERKAWDVSYRLTHKTGKPVWVRERGHAVFEGDQIKSLEGLVVGAEAEFKLNSKLEQTLAQTSARNQEIVEMSGRITSSVRELSMLSVNARIEAARSGEAGQGFAIVANEIKTLADRNAKWASEISKVLSDGAP